MIAAAVRRTVCIILLTIMIAASASGQDSEPPEAASGVYIDFLFTEYIELETSVLELVEAETISDRQLTLIDSMLSRASEANRTDIISRLNMLRFVAETEIASIEQTDNAESFIAALSRTEQKRQAEIRSAGIGRTAAGISIGTAAFSGAVFAVSSLVSHNYYDKYTQTESADQAAFYLFWWQFLDNISAGSALVTITCAAAAGILTALF